MYFCNHFFHQNDCNLSINTSQLVSDKLMLDMFAYGFSFSCKQMEKKVTIAVNGNC